MQKNQKIIIGISFAVIIAIAAILIISFSNKDKPVDYVIQSEIYPNLYYLGEIVDNNFSGDTRIIDPDTNFRLDGYFENGVFKEGYISFIYNDYDYFIDGTFENFNLQEGVIRIYTDDKIIEKRGTFVDNKLNGNGSISITNRNDSSILFSYAGKFEDDIPIYN